ncbi:MAG: glycosyltransferase [Desulfobacterales bacterium]|nr:MAG: glycosyltransferase [Desulfobacterales bacterium]
MSLIIPAHNEEAYLPRLLDTVDDARAQYLCRSEAVEVVVADNASTDSTRHVARRRGCRLVYVEKRIIAAVRNAGASVARGQLFAFVDADARIHPDTFNAIDCALATGKVVAGATGVKLERMSLGIAVAYMIMVPMVWATGMDTGVVFCRRKDFETVGGYNEGRLFAEDVQFLMDLKRLGRIRRQKLTRVTSAKAIASARKFDKYGDWHYVWMMFRSLYWLLLSPCSLDKFALTYWYDNHTAVHRIGGHKADHTRKGEPSG